jgi:isopenicillin N synthase-like dioxygenase
MTVAVADSFIGLTLVLQDDVPALEVLNQDGLWVDAPPTPGTFVCNVGQFLERQTNGLFQATVHRVRNKTGQERYSLPFFLTMDPDVNLEVLDCCKEKEKDSKYETITVGDLYIRRVLPARPKHPTSIKYINVPQEQWNYDMLLS